MRKESIVHEGEISSITDDEIEVTINSQSACASCHANGACSSADSATRHIKVKNTSLYTNLSLGKRVIVEGTFHSGLKAVLFAYVIPFVLILVTLMICSEITNNNLISGIVSLGITIPYFVLIYFFKNKFEEEFSFIIKTEA